MSLLPPGWLSNRPLDWETRDCKVKSRWRYFSQIFLYHLGKPFCLYCLFHLITRKKLLLETRDYQVSSAYAIGIRVPSHWALSDCDGVSVSDAKTSTLLFEIMHKRVYWSVTEKTEQIWWTAPSKMNMDRSVNVKCWQVVNHWQWTRGMYSICEGLDRLVKGFTKLNQRYMITLLMPIWSKSVEAFAHNYVVSLKIY